MLEKDMYKKVALLLLENGYDEGAYETKVVRGGTFNPNIVRKEQKMYLTSTKPTYYKIRDVGVHNKFLDFVICRKKYLVLLWDYNLSKYIIVIDMQVCGKDIWGKPQKMLSLLENKTYCSILKL